ncbi:5'-Nucleotidase domain protein [Ignavibacterium album JCM 16511]|uniref:5'-Nucleotidase domain protein n=1 Tax=Ignavibacterium album (strain DSM 19864 / JCM 16511 / NBRC 101810 / Mat9-16) TaxID=945713 RepID=I0AIE4_IGNAJ|nr:5'-Nucleotidase domain protein [Ignavibacterium album JCM 16511]
MIFLLSIILIAQLNIQSAPLPQDEKKFNSLLTDSTQSGLIFEKDLIYRLKDSSYTDKIQLKNLSQRAQAIQFKISVNKSADDSLTLTFQNITKGNDIADTSWVLAFNIIRGTIQPNGASADDIYVLIYNQNYNNGLQPGNYDDLLGVSYRVANLQANQDSLKSSFRLSNVAASTYDGFPIDITPSRNEFKVITVHSFAIPKRGLVFQQDTVYRLEDFSYTDVMQLKGLSAQAQALQFRLKVNQAINDQTILSFQSIQKGNDISDPSWVLNYNVIRGPITPNGASQDEILVLLYNLNQNNGLPPGNYNDLFRVNYRVADLPPLIDSIKSSFLITDALASTYQGFPIDITPSRNELTVIARNRVGFYGDVNGDGCLDILDILMVVDHIIGRDSLEGEAFLRADLAPWVPGTPEPNPDGVVNVQDLSLLQNIILTGVYPNGIEINACSFVINSPAGGMTNNNQQTTIYLSKNGITLYLDSDVDIRGMQAEFSNIGNFSGEMNINTALGQGHYYFGNNILRVLLYDRMGIKTVKSGNNFVAHLPFPISNPQNVMVEKLILISSSNERLLDNKLEIKYQNPPPLPLEFNLYQNFPNPFNPGTKIAYSIPRDEVVTIKIFDLLGNEIQTLVNEFQTQNYYEIQFNAENLSSGIYFYQMKAGEFLQTKKMILLR